MMERTSSINILDSSSSSYKPSIVDESTYERKRSISTTEPDQLKLISPLLTSSSYENQPTLNARQSSSLQENNNLLIISEKGQIANRLQKTLGQGTNTKQRSITIKNQNQSNQGHFSNQYVRHATNSLKSPTQMNSQDRSRNQDQDTSRLISEVQSGERDTSQLLIRDYQASDKSFQEFLPQNQLKNVLAQELQNEQVTNMKFIRTQQSKVFLLASLRFFLLGLTNNSGLVFKGILNSDSRNQTETLSQDVPVDNHLLTDSKESNDMSFFPYILVLVFAQLLFSQVIDNLSVKNQKNLFVMMEVFMGLSSIASAIINILDVSLYNQNDAFSILNTGEPICFVLATGLFMITLIQIFNWFSRRLLGLFVGLVLSMQYLGTIVAFGAAGSYKESFPVFDTGDCSDEEVYRQASVSVCVGLLFVALSFYDHKNFVLQPLAIGIIISMQEKRDQDHELLRIMALMQTFKHQKSADTQNQNDNILRGTMQGNEQSAPFTLVADQFQVTLTSHANAYQKVAGIPEFKRLALVSLLSETASSMSLLYLVIYLTPKQYDLEMERMLFYGFFIGSLTLGLWTDYLAKGFFSYRLLLFVIVVDVVNMLIGFACGEFLENDYSNDKSVYLYCFIVGYFKILLYNLTVIQIPLKIAGVQRDLNSPNALPMAAQLYTFATISGFLFPIFLAMIFFYFLDLLYWNKPIQILVTFLLYLVSFYPLRKAIQIETKQYNELQIQRKSDLYKMFKDEPQDNQISNVKMQVDSMRELTEEQDTEEYFVIQSAIKNKR